MTLHQIMVLRWLRMRADNPQLNHRGTEPEADDRALYGHGGHMHAEPTRQMAGQRAETISQEQARLQRERAEREFYRLEER